MALHDFTLELRHPKSYTYIHTYMNVNENHTLTCEMYTFKKYAYISLTNISKTIYCTCTTLVA